MSLTVYIGQSLVFAPLFNGYGLGWFANIGQLNAGLLGLLFWLVQMRLANLWFNKFHYGPVEWAWRSATLMRVDIPLIKRN